MHAVAANATGGVRLELAASSIAPSPVLDSVWYNLVLQRGGEGVPCFAVSCRDLPVRLMTASMQVRSPPWDCV